MRTSVVLWDLWEVIHMLQATRKAKNKQENLWAGEFKMCDYEWEKGYSKGEREDSQEEENERGEENEREVMTGNFSPFLLLTADVISHSPRTHSRSNLKLLWTALLKPHNQMKTFITYTLHRLHTLRHTPNTETTENEHPISSLACQCWKWKKIYHSQCFVFMSHRNDVPHTALFVCSL